MTTKKRKAGSLMLNKDSAPEQIKSYFSKVLELTKGGKDFPINLDDVWELVYKQKAKALAVLRSDFVEGEDFYLSQKGKVMKNSDLINGIKIDAFLTVSCLEYFIAKRVKPVFEVYRKVFHKAINTVNEQKTLTQETEIKEGKPYLQRFSDKTIYTAIFDGESFFNLSTILRFVGYKQGAASRYGKMIGSPDVRIIGDELSPQFYMINKSGVEKLLHLVPKNIDYFMVEVLYKDLFDIELPNKKGSYYLYRYTAEEMLDILHMLNKRPINRNDVADLLELGRRPS